MDNIKGYIYAAASSSTFGLAPFFTISLLSSGFSSFEVLAYRWGVASFTLIIFGIFLGETFCINRKNFGFVFSSENAVLKDMNIQNIMVYKARNLLTDGKSYEPIYKTQVTTYIQRVMRLATGDFKQENIVEFFSSKPTSQRSRWMEKKDCINAIIGNGDDIRYSIDEAAGYCTLDIAFNGNVKNLEIEINRVNSEDRTF